MKTTLEVKNIKCGGCAEAIKTGLKSFPEIAEVQVDIPAGKVEVTHGDHFPLLKIREKLSAIGYPEKM